MFALVDANSFYCSAEQVFRPEWRGKPIVVLSNNDGCVVAANRLAKEAGIPKFKPFFEVRALCEKKGVIALSSNYELYSDLSAKMMNVISRFAPEQHIYSIDESFLSFERTSPAIPDLYAHGMKIRRAVWKECRLPVCVGFGPTLTLAKIANHAAKKIPGFHGVCVIQSERERIEILALLEVGDVWGIGKRTQSHLKVLGIKSALDLAQAPLDVIKKNFNVEIERTVRELNGQGCKRWDSVRADKQQIFSTRSVGSRITDLESLKQALSKHAGIASKKAREQGSLCRVMICFANSSPFDKYPVSRRFTHHFAYPTADAHQITKTASMLADRLFVEDVRFYKIGIGLVDLVDGRHEQPDLFNPNPNNMQLMKIFDGINHRFGTDTIFLGSQGINQKWSMRREMLTNQYTTNWKHLPRIRC